MFFFSRWLPEGGFEVSLRAARRYKMPLLANQFSKNDSVVVKMFNIRKKTDELHWMQLIICQMWEYPRYRFQWRWLKNAREIVKQKNAERRKTKIAQHRKWDRVTVATQATRATTVKSNEEQPRKIVLKLMRWKSFVACVCKCKTALSEAAVTDVHTQQLHVHSNEHKIDKWRWKWVAQIGRLFWRNDAEWLCIV